MGTDQESLVEQEASPESVEVSRQDALNEQVAKLLGWRDVQRSSLNRNCLVGRKPGAFDIEGRTFVPNFCEDLNAMHEAENLLSGEQVTDYGWELDRITKADCGVIGGPSGHDLTRIARATAMQRAEAFVKTRQP